MGPQFSNAHSVSELGGLLPLPASLRERGHKAGWKEQPGRDPGSRSDRGASASVSEAGRALCRPRASVTPRLPKSAGRDLRAG